MTETDHTRYYDCKRNWFASEQEALDWYQQKCGYPAQKVCVTTTGWLVGPVPEEGAGDD
jgi:hypothetical protein